LWTGSTEVFRKPGAVHESMTAFEQGLDRNDPEISPSMLYAWAALQEGCAYANGAPNLSLDTPALSQLAEKLGLPIAGKDFKTGQTLIKTVLAPMLKIRMLGLAGWFSTNILGNRDGEVLLDPDSFRTKEESKLDVLSSILSSDVSPELYSDIFHLVNINYYPPRGDAKEGWDNIDLFGWLDYPMQLKVNFLARDSILAAPLVLDLVLFLDLAARAGLAGPQDWLSFYFKTPQSSQPHEPCENDVFRQHAALQDMLHWFSGQQPADTRD
jgi:myo-inositol-1-phosphate synthase